MGNEVSLSDQGQERKYGTYALLEVGNEIQPLGPEPMRPNPVSTLN